MLTLHKFFSNLSIEVPSVISQQIKQHRFDYSKTEYQIDDQARSRIKRYLDTTPLKLEDSGCAQQADSVIAFSFGDSDNVNIELAKQVDQLSTTHGNLKCYAQQEIEVHCKSPNVIAIQNVHYQTTKDIVQFVVDQKASKDVIVVAQAWHALRCVETCQALGLNVVALRVADGFPHSDPQPWVRNPINWIIKESHREIATGYEISEFYGLS